VTTNIKGPKRVTTFGELNGKAFEYETKEGKTSNMDSKPTSTPGKPIRSYLVSRVGQG
jgi:hypothetical protein